MLCFVETRVPQPWSLRPPLQCPRTKVPESRTEDKEEKKPRHWAGAVSPQMDRRGVHGTKVRASRGFDGGAWKLEHVARSVDLGSGVYLDRIGFGVQTPVRRSI